MPARGVDALEARLRLRTQDGLRHSEQRLAKIRSELGPLAITPKRPAPAAVGGRRRPLHPGVSGAERPRALAGISASSIGKLMSGGKGWRGRRPGGTKPSIHHRRARRRRPISSGGLPARWRSKSPRHVIATARTRGSAAGSSTFGERAAPACSALASSNSGFRVHLPGNSAGREGNPPSAPARRCRAARRFDTPAGRTIHVRPGARRRSRTASPPHFSSEVGPGEARPFSRDTAPLSKERCAEDEVRARESRLKQESGRRRPRAQLELPRRDHGRGRRRQAAAEAKPSPWAKAAVSPALCVGRRPTVRAAARRQARIPLRPRFLDRPVQESVGRASALVRPGIAPAKGTQSRSSPAGETPARSRATSRRPPAQLDRRNDPESSPADGCVGVRASAAAGSPVPRRTGVPPPEPRALLDVGRPARKGSLVPLSRTASLPTRLCLLKPNLPRPLGSRGQRPCRRRGLL